MPIRTQCRFCGKPINAGDELAGRAVKCPGCGGVLKIPGTSDAAPTPTPAPSQTAQQPPAAQQPVYTPQPILVDHEALAPPPQHDAAANRPPYAAPQPDDPMTGPEWFLAIVPLLDVVGGIVAILYLTRGNPKGRTMLGATLASAAGWVLLILILRLTLVVV